MVKKVLKTVDYGLIIIALALFGIGIVALHSANGGVNGNMEEVTKQLIWFGAGFVGMIIVLLIDYDILREIMDSHLFFDAVKFGSGFIYTANLWSKKLVSVWQY